MSHILTLLLLIDEENVADGRRKTKGFVRRLSISVTHLEQVYIRSVSRKRFYSTSRAEPVSGTPDA